MLIVRPVEITDAVLTATDVPEMDEAEFVFGTTYIVGDRVMVTTAGVHAVFVSLVPANQGNGVKKALLMASLAKLNATRSCCRNKLTPLL